MIAIVNVTPDWGIGSHNELLVHIHADMRRFRAQTQHHTVIVGRKTLATFPNGAPLKNRENIVLTRNPDFLAEGAVVCTDLRQLRTILSDRDPDTVFLCGGESTYRLLLPYCSKAFVTLSEVYRTADRFFPNLNRMQNWTLTDPGIRETEDGVAYRFMTYTNRNVQSL